MTNVSDASERGRLLDSLGRLVHQHRAYLSAVARGEGLTPEDALDVVQETFFVVVERAEAPSLVEGEADDARRFLSTLTRNLARNHRRLHAQHKPHESDDALVHALADADLPSEALVARAEEHIRLIGCVRTLQKVQRAVVTLRMLDERAGEDVARELGIPPGHVAVLLHRAKKNLLACMTVAP